MLEVVFFKILLEVMGYFFGCLCEVLVCFNDEINEILVMMEVVYKCFFVEYGFKFGLLMFFLLFRYEKEIDCLQVWCDEYLNIMVSLLIYDKWNIMQKFFEEVVIQVCWVFEYVNKDVEIWLWVIMVLMEIQVCEYQIQLKCCFESIKCIYLVIDMLEDCIIELESIEKSFLQQVQVFEDIVGCVKEMLLLLDIWVLQVV